MKWKILKLDTRSETRNIFNLTQLYVTFYLVINE